MSETPFSLTRRHVLTAIPVLAHRAFASRRASTARRAALRSALRFTERRSRRRSDRRGAEHDVRRRRPASSPSGRPPTSPSNLVRSPPTGIITRLWSAGGRKRFAGDRDPDEPERSRHWRFPRPAQRTDHVDHLDGRARGHLRRPASALPFTHWNSKIAGGGVVQPAGWQSYCENRPRAVAGATIRLASAAPDREPPTGIVFRGDAYVEDYYSADDVWIGLSGKLADGSAMEYRLSSPP